MIEHTLAYTFPAAFSLLPAHMESAKARAMLLAIGLQESRFEYRRQIRGPAVGLFQFEKGGGVRGVLSHPASADHAARACEALLYAADADIVYEALADNDVLATVFARLLLWTIRDALPTTVEEGWRQYLSVWRPGKPHPETWPDFYERAETLAKE